MTGVCRKKVRHGNTSVLKKCALTLFLLSTAVFVVLFPERSSVAVIGGVKLFYEKLFPALFPMSIVSAMLLKSGSVPNFLIKRISRSFGISKASATAFIIGILSGFPIGAMLIGQLYENGRIEKDEAERMIGVSTCPSPAFLIVSVGNFVLYNKMLGVSLWLGQMTAAVVMGIAGRSGKENVILNGYNGYDAYDAYDGTKNQLPTLNDICDSIGRAAQAMLSVAAFVCFFSLVCEMICGSLPSHTVGLQTAVCGFLEIGSGMGSATKFEYPTNLCLCAAFAGWSGLSVHMQCAALVGSLSVKRCIKQKIAMAVISVPLTLVYAELFTKLLQQQ